MKRANVLIACCLLSAFCVPTRGQEECSEVEQALRAEQQRTAVLQREREDAVTKLTSASAKVQDYEHQIQELRAELHNAKENVSLSDFASTMVKTTSQQITYAVGELKLLATDLQQGRTAQLERILLQIPLAAAKVCQGIVAFVSQMLDQHLPSVKKQAGAAMGELDQLYQKHIAGLPGVAEALQLLTTTTTRIKAMIEARIKSQPMLASLDDPVSIQLLVYMLIGAPVLLVLLLVLLWLTSLVAPAKASSRSSGKKRGGAPKYD